MKLAEFTTVFVEGAVYWPKIVGNKALHENYDGDARQWAYELVPDDTQFLKEHRLLDRLKDNPDPKNPDKGEYLVLKKPEFNKDGDKNDPITIINNDDEVTDEDGAKLEGWDGRLIGSGTRVVAKLTIADFGKGKKKAIWTNALRIEKLVPYGDGEGGGSGSRDPFSDFGGSSDKAKSSTKPKAAKADSKGKAQELDDLDDDVPF
jgi:hypothetical protein